VRTSAVRYLHAAKRDLIYPSLAMQPPHSPLRASRFLVSATVILLCAFSDTSFAQRQTGTILQDAPLVLLPEKTRGPLLIMEKGVTVQVIRREGDWFYVTVQGSQWGDRTGYVEAKYVRLRPEQPPVPVAAPVPVPRVQAAEQKTLAPASVPTATPAAVATPIGEAPPVAPRPPRPVTESVSLKSVRRIFIEPMPGDLDQYISAEITKELKGRVVVVLDKANADAIMRGVGENKNGVGSAITGRYLGLHDNSTASITMIDQAETVVLWASEAGDRSLMWGALARGGQRKVADRLVNNLKKALSEAK
jgi:hypothetical protein